MLTIKKIEVKNDTKPSAEVKFFTSRIRIPIEFPINNLDQSQSRIRIPIKNFDQSPDRGSEFREKILIEVPIEDQNSEKKKLIEAPIKDQNPD